MAQSKEFSLLTKLTLSAAGFNTGVEQAKKKTSELAKGTEQASNTMKASFAGLTNIFPNLTGSLSGITSAVSGGIGAFKTMIPAIKGVGTALAATGITLVVIALSVAFAALASYLGGTSEGANKLKLAFSYITGAIKEYINRVQALGSAIWKMVNGDWKGMKEEFSKAFAGGFIDSVIAAAKHSHALMLELQNLTKQKRLLGYEEDNQLTKITELREKAKDFEAYPAQQRLAYLREAKELELKIGTTKTVTAIEFYNQLVAEQGLKKNLTSEEKDQRLEMYKQIGAAQREQNERITSYFKQEKKLVKEIADAADEKTKALEALKKSDSEGVTKPMSLKGSSITATGALQLDSSPIATAADIWGTLTKRIKEAHEAMIANQPEWMKLSGLIFSAENKAKLFQTAIGGVQNIIIDFAKTGKTSFQSLVTSMLSGIRSIINGLIAQALAGQLAANSKFGLPGLIMAGIGMAAVEGLVGSLPAFASGGIVQGSSYGGDQVHAMVNSGEMILNAGQQGNLFDMINAGRGGSGGGEVTFRIDGTQLVGVLNNHNRKMSHIR